MNIQLALIQFECYDDGNRLIGLTTVDPLPDVEWSTTDIKGAGIAGTVSWPVKGNLNNLQTTLNWLTLTADGSKYLKQTSGHNLSLRAAVEDYDAGTGERKVVAVRVDLRGHTTKFGLGKLEVGETMDTTLDLTLDWLKVTIDGREVCEIDKFNYKSAVNGEDYLTDVRAATGRD